MNRLLISSEQKPRDNTILLQFEDAGKWLSALRDNHFVECKVVLEGEFAPGKHKYLIGVPRLLKEEGELVVDSTGLTAQSREKVKQLISTMGLHEKSDGVFSKQPQRTKQEAKAQLPLGFHAQSTKIDQDSLLKDDILEKKPKIQSCATKVKACANCSCGRKQQEQQKSKGELVQSITEGTAKSNCGNCYLGDAFRCATCPYKGLPAFKPGEKIELTQVEDVKERAEEGAVKVEGGKVRLEL